MNRLGYGESSPLWKKILTLLAIGLPALALDFTLWWAPLITLAQFGAWYILSRQISRVSWLLSEFMAGAAQGAVIVIGVLR